ncbi:DUF4236 domain-containing protein [Acinetobacter gerneri]|uniref:DUF4236 domain-containing protein n=1 Tax=Acinetobacter gerneri TaxID=202952 RepID=UPI00358F961A
MGFNFRKSFKIAPGIRLNVGKKGFSSVSVGGKGARVSIGKKGTRTTVGLPGSGLSYSTFKSHSANQQRKNFKSNLIQENSITDDVNYRKVSFLLGCGIFLMPYIFSWLTLRQGYSSKARWISFTWMILLLIFAFSN